MYIPAYLNGMVFLVLSKYDSMEDTISIIDKLVNIKEKSLDK